MSTIYDRGRDLVIRQLAPIAQGGKGQVATLVYVVPGEIDEDTQTTGDDTTVTQQISGAEKAIKAERVNGTTIQDGDSEFVMSPVTVGGADVVLPKGVPVRGILTLANGTKRNVVRIEPKEPSGLLISATLHLRGIA